MRLIECEALTETQTEIEHVNTELDARVDQLAAQSQLYERTD